MKPEDEGWTAAETDLAKHICTELQQHRGREFEECGQVVETILAHPAIRDVVIHIQGERPN